MQDPELHWRLYSSKRRHSFDLLYRFSGLRSERKAPRSTKSDGATPQHNDLPDDKRVGTQDEQPEPKAFQRTVRRACNPSDNSCRRPSLLLLIGDGDDGHASGGGRYERVLRKQDSVLPVQQR